MSELSTLEELELPWTCHGHTVRTNITKSLNSHSHNKEICNCASRCTWSSSIGRKRAQFIVEACNAYHDLIAERDKWKEMYLRQIH
jgi:hypothetical protein